MQLIDYPDAKVYDLQFDNDSAIDPELIDATHGFMLALSGQLYTAGHDYRKEHPQLALMLYTRAYQLFMQAEGSSLKNHVAYLYAIGLCHGALKDAEMLERWRPLRKKIQLIFP